MNSRFSKEEISISDEKRIIFGLIVSTEFCKRVHDFTDIDYFINSYTRTIAKWCLQFYKEYGKAPFLHINDIWESKRAKIKKEDAELIDILLTNISKQHKSDSLNIEYLVNTAEEYFRVRELEIHVDTIAYLKDKGDLAGAEEEISRFHSVSLKLDSSIYVNPGDDKTIQDIYNSIERQTTDAFTLSGDLGKFIGRIYKGNVVGITAPAKRGKSHLITAMQKTCIVKKIPTLKFAIEMQKEEEIPRLDKAFYPLADYGGIYTYPVLDCVKNQTGECGYGTSGVVVRERIKKGDEYVLSELQLNDNHEVCTKCRDRKNSHSFLEPTVYRYPIKRKALTYENVKKYVQPWRSEMRKYARMVIRPKYSLTYDLMMRDIDNIISRYNFIPGGIFLDYVDILKIDSSAKDFRMVEEQWELLQKVAGMTGCWIITATQANKYGHTVNLLASTDQSGSYGKNRHVNMMLGINQNPEEKREGVYRINKLDSRSSYQDPFDCCYCLQDLFTGQMILDSFWQNKYEIYRR